VTFISVLFFCCSFRVLRTRPSSRTCHECYCDFHCFMCYLLCCYLGSASALVTFICVLCTLRAQITNDQYASHLLTLRCCGHVHTQSSSLAAATTDFVACAHRVYLCPLHSAHFIYVLYTLRTKISCLLCNFAHDSVLVTCTHRRRRQRRRRRLLVGSSTRFSQLLLALHLLPNTVQANSLLSTITFLAFATKHLLAHSCITFFFVFTKLRVEPAFFAP
jgi:hypothetical protein